MQHESLHCRSVFENVKFLRCENVMKKWQKNSQNSNGWNSVKNGLFSSILDLLDSSGPGDFENHGQSKNCGKKKS